MYDGVLGLRARPPPSNIVMVAIDFDSLRTIAPWPWPRDVQAQLVDKIADGNPRAIVYDLLLATSAPGPGDARLRQAMRRAPVYLPAVQEDPIKGHIGPLTAPAPEFASVAHGVGRSNPEPDRDGIVRGTVLFSGRQGVIVRQLMEVVAETQGGSPFTGARRPGQRLLIPYGGPPGHIQRLSAASILKGRVSPAMLRDKFVLVGATAPGLLDNYPIPLASVDGMANVEIDANILDGILAHVFIRDVPKPVGLALSIGAIWVLFAGMLMLQPRQLAILSASGGGLVVGGSVLGLLVAGLWAPPSACIITGLLFQGVWSSRRLQAASDFFARELNDLQTRAGGALLPVGRGAGLPVGDSTTRQMILIDETRRRMGELRRFVNELLANLPDPVFVVSRRGHIVMFNPAAVELGRSLGRPTAVGEPIQPLFQDLEAQADEGRKLWPPEPGPPPPRGVAPGGRILEARYTTTGADEDGPRGWMVQLVDVTDLVAAMRQREDALSLFTHDMRAPQSAILAALSHADFQVAPEPLRESIRRNATRTLGLADGFVRLAQAEMAAYDLEPIDLYLPLSDAADALWPLAQAASVRIVAPQPDLEFVVTGDRGMLARAAINLIDNAIKVSPAGSSIVCALEPADLLGRPAVKLSVSDVAFGMTPEQVTSLFNRFARTSTRTREGRVSQASLSNVGLGLAVVHTVVTRHQGRVDCESAVGKGATFTITLPLAEGVSSS